MIESVARAYLQAYEKAAAEKDEAEEALSSAAWRVMKKTGHPNTTRAGQAPGQIVGSNAEGITFKISNGIDYRDDFTCFFSFEQLACVTP